MSNNNQTPTPVATPSATAAPRSSQTPSPGATPSSSSRHRWNNRSQNSNPFSSSRFIPKIASIETLATSSENKGQDFTKFQKSLHHHVLTTFRNSKDMSKAILEFTDPLTDLQSNRLTLATVRTKNNLNLVAPVTGESETEKFDRESDNSDRKEMAKMIFNNEIKQHAERERDLTQNLTILWATIMGQCTPALHEEVNGDPDYTTSAADFDSVWLLKTLQKITAGVNKTTNKYYSAFKAMKSFYTTQQSHAEGIDEFYGRFDNAKDLVQLFDANVVDITSLLAKEQLKDTSMTKESVMQRYLAVALIMNSNKSKYESLWNKLENDLLVGQDSYPTTLGAATHLLTNWKTHNPNPRPLNPHRPGTGGADTGSGGAGVNFAQIAMPANNDFSALPGYDPSRPTMAPSRKPPHNISAHITCSRCTKLGHYATACPFIIQSAPQHFQIMRPAVQLNQVQTDNILRPGSIIVDSGSTFNCFKEASLLTNMHSCDRFTTFSNGGGMTYDDKGTINLFPALEAYHNPNCLVNIISLDLLQAQYHTQFDSANKNAFTVHVSDNMVITFEGFGSGLYFYNLNSIVNPYPYSLLNTVKENKSFFTRREIQGAEAAREQQGQIGWPSDQEYHEIIRDNLLKNSKATLDDLRRANYLFGGPAVNLLKGKSVYTPLNNNEPIERVPLPPIILKTHPTDVLDIDFMYCQGAPYLLMKTNKIKFQAIQSFNRISRRKKNTQRITYKRGPNDIINGVEKVLNTLRRRGFQINSINADNEFQKMEGKVTAHIEICAAGQHVPRIERGIRFVKERTRCFWVPLPFKKVPKLMIDECLIMVISCLNDFPAKDGISDTLSPASIVLGRGQLDGNHFKATFGRYYEVYCGTDNTNKERRVSAICLRPSNSQGGYFFMSLETGRKIHGYRFTELAMPDHIIDMVHDFADAEGAAALDNDGCPVFEWELGTPVMTPEEAALDNDNDNTVVEESDEESNPDDKSDSEDDDDNDNDDSDDESISDPETEEDDNSLETEPNAPEESRSDATNKSRSDEESLDLRSEGDSSDDESVDHTRNEIDPQNIVEGKRERSKPPVPNVESFRGEKYNINMLNIAQDDFSRFERIKNGIYSTSVGICFNQMTASKGIKLFGERAVAAMFKEYKQLDDLTVLGRLTPESLTPEQKRTALRAINLIKEKRCGKLKGRTCADGSTQRKYVPREEASSPTLSLEALMALLLINAFEERDTAVFDVPGAYLHAEIPGDKFAILKIEGAFADIMCEVNPEYKSDIRFENGKKVLYVQILRALYGMIESALLWYTLYTDVLQKEGFEINPYDQCVANKNINGKQCTIAWYVDDNLLSHVETSVVDDILKLINGYFPGLVIERGKKLNFLGMEIEFLDKGKLKLGLVQYIQGMIEELEEAITPYGENLDRKYPHPAAKWLFTIKKDTNELNTAKGDLYRTFVAKLLWVMKRGRPDIEPTVSFLSTRVKAPTKDDWHKLKRLMSWLKQTATDVRIIGADDLLHMIVLIDSAHAVHDNMRGHTGGVTSFGTGLVDQKSSKQKMNTRSSTETEHVGTSEYLPKAIFFELFMTAQGYPPNTTLAKDNISEIRMLINGKKSCTSNSKHVAIKYFWCTDRIQNGNITVKHCPTEKMIADYMSKPVQGKLFHTFRNVIMGWAHISTLFDAFSSNEERVGDNGNLTDNGNLPVLPIEPKARKLTYAETTKVSLAVNEQNKLIANRIDPIA
jgi:hypothetical protein